MNTDNQPRELIALIEKFQTIEKLPEATLIFREVSKDANLLDESTALGKKYKKAQEICKETQVIDLREKYEEESKKKVRKRASK